MKNNWRKQGAESDENEDEDNIDFFNEDEDNIDLFNEDEKEDGGVMYGDYFTNDEMEWCEKSDENESSEDEETTVKDGSKKDLLASDSDSKITEKELKSSHEFKEERLPKNINRLKEVAIGLKPWQMTGEVAAMVRRVNSRSI